MRMSNEFNPRNRGLPAIRRFAPPVGFSAIQMPSFLHTCYRIGDIDRSVAFYEKLGFEEVRRMPIGEEAINVFMALQGETRGWS